MLEPDALKGARPVLRRGGASNRSSLFDMFIQFSQYLLLSFCLETALVIQTYVLKFPTIFNFVPSFKDSNSHLSKIRLK
jgi:hypothetical protein